ncbi:unnamed protein product, partial [Penicillium bialowiezense]
FRKGDMGFLFCSYMSNLVLYRDQLATWLRLERERADSAKLNEQKPCTASMGSRATLDGHEQRHRRPRWRAHPMSSKFDKNVASAKSAWFIGLVLAPPESVRANDQFSRQLEVHDGKLEKGDSVNPDFPKEATVAASDAMVTTHTNLCYRSKCSLGPAQIYSGVS